MGREISILYLIICFTNLTKHLKIVRACCRWMNDGHAIVCPPVLGLLKSHLRCCEPHLSHHPTIDFVDFHFTPAPDRTSHTHPRQYTFPNSGLSTFRFSTTTRPNYKNGQRTTVWHSSANIQITSDTLHSGAWARPRPSASRTPQQSRSSNASPAPTSSTTAPAAAKPATTPAAPAGNVWAQRAAAQKPSPAVTPKAAKKEQSTPAATPATQEKHVPANNFNYGEVKQMMGQKEASSVYKVDTSASTSDCKFLHG
jgi:hypothetical protein